MSGRIVLSDGIAEAEIVPDLGAGVARYDLLGRGPLFRPAREGTRDPFGLACNLLLPWSNRISGGGFAFEGQFHPLQANWPGEPCPIHGNAFPAAWTVAEAAPTAARLTLDSDGPGPFRYRAEAHYAMEAGALEIRLAVTNLAPRRLPYGCGLHPTLPRSPFATLTAPASAVWLEDAQHLPTGLAALESRPDWDFRCARRLPLGWINNGFDGWGGRAEAHWPERDLGLAFAASAELSTYIVYSPGQDADFFCFEPVSHPVDAFNLADGPEAYGLRVLQQGETLRAHCRFTPISPA